MTIVSENELGISNDDFWKELYKDVPIPLKPGEKTVPMMIDEIPDRSCEYQTMSNMVKKWVKEGKLVSVGMRISNGKLAQAYKVVV